MHKPDAIAISLQNISVSFSGVTVLRNASFSLKKNDIHAIVGKNGAGKSSFMKVLTGVYTPDTGDIYVSDKLVQPGKKHEAVAMVYQDLSLVPSMSVMQNIFLVNHPYKLWGFWLQDRKARTRTEEILHSVGIPHVSPEQLVETLSPGEAQLVEIAKAILSDPEIIIFDEPTASLSDVETEILFNTIEQLRGQGLSVIYITHYLEDVLKICNTVTVLRNGEVVSTRPIAESTLETIVADMLGEESHNIRDVRTKQEKERGTESPVLELHNAQTSLVGPITLHAYAGEIIGIAGLLGSGRTEIFRMIYGMDPLQSGSICVQGKSLRIKSPKKAVEQGIMLIPEERRKQGLVMDFDISENIAMSNLRSLLSNGLINPKKLGRMADTMISRLQVKTTGRNQVVRLLSGGNQQKVVIGKCLASNPRILLLDDPTFGVDIHAKEEIMRIIEAFADAGNVVLFLSSEFSEVASFCDRTYIIKKKKIVNEVSNYSLKEGDLLKLVQ